MRIAAEDLKAAALIRDAAMRLFAERGAAGVTVRQIAAAAGVSAGLVMHHYGSKKGLQDAVDRRAVAFFEEMIGELGRIGEEDGSASLAEMLVDRMESEPAMTGYVRRLLAEGGQTADVLFGSLFEATAAGMRSLVAAGIARPAADEPVRAAFLLANDLAVVLLRGPIARATGTDPLSRDGLARWSAAVMDVYAGGVFAVPAAPGMPASDQRSAREEQSQ